MGRTSRRSTLYATVPVPVATANGADATAAAAVAGCAPGRRSGRRGSATHQLGGLGGNCCRRRRWRGVRHRCRGRARRGCRGRGQRWRRGRRQRRCRHGRPRHATHDGTGRRRRRRCRRHGACSGCGTGGPSNVRGCGTASAHSGAAGGVGGGGPLHPSFRWRGRYDPQGARAGGQGSGGSQRHGLGCQRRRRGAARPQLQPWPLPQPWHAPQPWPPIQPWCGAEPCSTPQPWRGAQHSTSDAH